MAASRWSSFSRGVVGFSMVFAGALRLSAELPAQSPFMPEGGAPAPVANAPRPLEYTGFIQIEDEVLYRLRDPQKKVGTWVKLNEADSVLAVVVKHHDETSDTLRVEYQGQVITLAPKAAKIIGLPAGGVAAALPGSVAAPISRRIQMGRTIPPPSVANPQAADEATRLNGLVEDIRRRRAQRQQAAAR